MDDQNNPKNVIKSSFENDGINDILNEYQGFCWYAHQLNLDPIDVVSLYQYNHSYATLKTKFHHGDLGNPYSSIETNYPCLISALTYYFKIFGKTDYICSHGDYSLSNLVFLHENVEWIIDWEHFNKILPPEFDILNCIMEICYFNVAGMGTISNAEVNKIQDLLLYASNNIPLSESALTTPARCLSAYYKSNKNLFGSQYSKYPLAACPVESIHKIDAFFNC